MVTKKLFWKGIIFASMLFWIFSEVAVYGQVAVKWETKCLGYATDGEVFGGVSPSVDLTDDQIAYKLVQEGQLIWQRSCPKRPKHAKVWVRLCKNQQCVSAIVTDNDISSYDNPMSAEARRTRSIKAFISKFKVEVWLDSNEMGNRLTSNPFQWKGKIVGSEAEFGGMLSEDSGLFAGNPNLLGPILIVVKKLPSARFTRSGERFLLAGRIQGTSQVQLPFLGNKSVPELSFIGAAEPAPLPMPR